MAELYHQVWIAAPTAIVYEAISTAAGIAGWWDKPTAVKSDSGVVLEFNPGPEHGVLRAKVLAAIRDQRVEWEFVSTHPKNSPAFAWTGTRASFGSRGAPCRPGLPSAPTRSSIFGTRAGTSEASGRPSPSASPRRPA
jgi:uncharacterized protein YndB with AHSA1/START domain